MSEQTPVYRDKYLAALMALQICIKHNKLTVHVLHRDMQKPASPRQDLQLLPPVPRASQKEQSCLNSV